MAEQNGLPADPTHKTPSCTKPSSDAVERWNNLWRRGAMTELVHDLTQVLNGSRACVDAAVRLALAHWHNGEPAEAMAAVAKAEQISPSHPDVTYCRGLFLAVMGSEQESLQSLARTVHVDPCHWNGHVLMGMLQSRLGHHSKAIESLNRAEAVDGDDAGLHFQLGIAHACAEHEVLAREAFDNAAELECEAFSRVPLQASDDDPLERILGRLQDDTEAMDVLADLPPAETEPALTERLETTFRHAAETHPEYPDVQYRCGRLLARMGRRTDAVAHLEQAVKLNERFVKARLALATCYEDIDGPDRAAKQLELALEQAGQHPDVHFRLGQCYRTLGRTDEAAIAMRKATELNPDFAAAHEALGELTE